MLKHFISPSLLILVLAAAGCASDTTRTKSASPHDNGGITLPAGFRATVFADEVGGARHLAVHTNGDVYVKLDALNQGRGILRLRDTNRDGVAEDISGFGNYPGTGIVIQDGFLYASSDESIYRYRFAGEQLENTGSPELVVTGLLSKRQHASKSLAVDQSGNIYVGIGAPSNSCQERDRRPGSMGMDPCPILDSAAGIWQFRANGVNQGYGSGKRYASGLRHVVGLDWNRDVDALFVMQHGRDDLHRLFPDLYSVEENTELPSEEMFRIQEGGNYGWPYCYYDQIRNKRLLSPEYGGDKNKTTRCENVPDPIYAFPGHWAPNGLLFYRGSQFPEKYRQGAFIAFHGSWNRAPRDQEGYFVVFVPFKDGKPSGKYEVFADGFAGATKTPQGAKYRPCGLAEGPDGSLYISDDKGGRIWKVNYTGK